METLNNNNNNSNASALIGSSFKEATGEPATPSTPVEQPAIELEHAIGFSAIPNALHLLPPHGTEFLYASGGSIVVGSVHDAHSQFFLRGHDTSICCLSVSTSGRLVASGENGRHADVLVWDLPNRKLLFRLSEHDCGIAAIGFSDDERLLCSIGVPEDGRVYVWDTTTGAICATQQKLAQHVTSIAWGGMFRDVKRRDTTNYQFATAGNRMLLLWVLNPFTGELFSSKIDQTVVRDYTCVTFTPDRETLIAGSTSGDFSVVSVKTRRLLKNVAACSCGVNAVHFSPTTGGVFVGGGDGLLLHYDQEFVDTSAVQLDASPIVGIAVSSSLGTDKLIVGTQAGSLYQIQVVAAPRGLQSKLLFENHSDAVVRVSFASEVSDRFATISKDSTIRIWDASDYSVVSKCVVASGGSPTSLQFSLDILLSGWTDGSIKCHNSDTAQQMWSIDNAHTGGVTAIVLSYNQRFIVSGGVGGEVRVWDIRKRDMVSHLKEHCMAVTDLVVYRDDAHVVSCSRDRSILCWDLRNEKRISSHIQRMGGINTVALASNQKLLLSAGQEKRISYWDLRIESPVNIINNAHDEEATCIAVAHRLDLFASGGNDRMVKIWNYTNGQLVMNCIGHSAAVRGLKFSPDDRQLVSVGDDGSILIWNVYTST